MVATSTQTQALHPGMEKLWETVNNNEKVLMKDPSAVKEKLSVILKDGPSKLQVMTDFDYTMSKFKDEQGNRCWTTHRVMEVEAAAVSPQLGQQLEALKEKYMAIEFDPSLSKEEKTPHMITWWTTAHDMLVSAGFTRAHLQDGVKRSKIFLRDKCADVIKQLEASKIPLVVFSAGIADVIDLVMQREFAKQPTYHLVGNHMDMDSDGKVIGFKPPLVHTFNKNESVVNSERGLAKVLEGRSNVLLLGDSLGDVHMDVGCKGEATALKVGFLNFKVEELRATYMDVYDVVIVEDDSWSLPHDIVSVLTNST